MEEFNTLVVELNDLYKRFQETPNKKTSASVRKNLMKIKTKSHLTRKEILQALKPVEPVEPVEPVDPVDPVDPVEPVAPVEAKKQKKEKIVKQPKQKKHKKEKEKVTRKDVNTTIKFG